LDGLLVLGETGVFARAEGGDLLSVKVLATQNPRSPTPAERAERARGRRRRRYPWESDATVTASRTLAGLLDVQIS
jgi:hypothetical protein